MSDVFISYARSTEAQAKQITEALRALGYDVWRDDELPAHRTYADVIEERLKAARAVVVLWSADAARSQWVRSEANRARDEAKLVQLRLDPTALPMPFDQIQCADLANWAGEADHAGWRKIVASIAGLMGASAPTPAALSTAPAATAPPDKPSIAVLPFTNITGGKDEDYFADGMVDEIVTALSRFPALFVIASGSSLAYRDDARGPSDIARELGVRYILDGSVRRSGPRVRISVKLADAIEGAQVWAERFDGEMEDVFALQDAVAEAVAGQLAPAIHAADTRRARERPTSDLTAYDLYLRALHRELDFSPEAIHDTIALLDQALERDPDFARALAFAALMHSIPELLGTSATPEESYRLALELGRRAMSTGSDDDQVVGIVSHVLLWAGEDIKAADTLAERAIALNPRSSFVWWVSGSVKLFDGRPALAIEHWATHLRLDPRSVYQAFITGGTGLALVLMGRLEEALPRLREAVQLLPHHPFHLIGLTAAYAHLGRVDEAKAPLSRLTARQIAYVLGLLRDAGHREIVRSGLALAGADV